MRDWLSVRIISFFHSFPPFCRSCLLLIPIFVSQLMVLILIFSILPCIKQGTWVKSPLVDRKAQRTLSLTWWGEHRRLSLTWLMGMDFLPEENKKLDRYTICCTTLRKMKPSWVRIAYIGRITQPTTKLPWPHNQAKSWVFLFLFFCFWTGQTYIITQTGKKKNKLCTSCMLSWECAGSSRPSSSWKPNTAESWNYKDIRQTWEIGKP